MTRPSGKLQFEVWEAGLGPGPELRLGADGLLGDSSGAGATIGLLLGFNCWAGPTGPLFGLKGAGDIAATPITSVWHPEQEQYWVPYCCEIARNQAGAQSELLHQMQTSV